MVDYFQEDKAHSDVICTLFVNCRLLQRNHQVVSVIALILEADGSVGGIYLGICEVFELIFASKRRIQDYIVDFL